MYSNIPAYRCLGTDSDAESGICSIDADISADVELSHNEGTSQEDWTTPCIGTGDAKNMRDCAIAGYTVGISIEDTNADPFLVDRSIHHILAYDIECEFFGPSSSNIEAPIFCALRVDHQNETGKGACLERRSKKWGVLNAGFACESPKTGL
jgi:hypothetical protein